MIKMMISLTLSNKKQWYLTRKETHRFTTIIPYQPHPICLTTHDYCSYRAQAFCLLRMMSLTLKFFQVWTLIRSSQTRGTRLIEELRIHPGLWLKVTQRVDWHMLEIFTETIFLNYHKLLRKDFLPIKKKFERHSLENLIKLSPTLKSHF